MKTILVTGSTKGLGLTITKELLADGFRVIGTGRAAIPPVDWFDHPHLAYRQLELGNWHNHHEFVLSLDKEFGALYGLVNNAAIGLDGVLATMHETEIDNLINVNVTGTIVLTKYAVRSMLRKREGRIVNVASIIATTGFNGLSVYGASKSALQGFTRSLARELGKANITVNSVSPGYMETEMTEGIKEADLERIKKRSPLGRLASTQEVANVVSLLLSPAGSGMTGIDIKVDAGSTI
jgi:3-oxoacyl-[acyl-carrier protein] reductase